jgi:hypothetical protein
MSSYMNESKIKSEQSYHQSMRSSSLASESMGSQSKQSKKLKDTKPPAKSTKSNRKYTDESSHATTIASLPMNEKAEKDENATSNLMRKRPPLISKLAMLEQSQFSARKAMPQIIPRQKVAWDYTLEEMTWMAIDMRQELRWKIGLSKLVAEACVEKCRSRAYDKQLSYRDHLPDREHLIAAASKLSRFIAEKFESLQKDILSNERTTSVIPMAENERLSSQMIDSVLEKVLSLSSLTTAQDQQPAIPFPPTNKWINNNQIDFNYLLKHQQMLCKDIYRFNSLGFGSMIHGTPYSGKTVALVYALLGWINYEKTLEKQYDGTPKIVVVALQKWLLRWLLILQQTVGHCCQIILCNNQDLAKLPLSDSKFPPTAPQIYLLCLEDYENFLQQLKSMKNLQGFIIDFRGYTTKAIIHPSFVNAENSSSSNLASLDRRNQILNHFIDVLPEKLPNRVLLTDENFRVIDRFSTLAFLLPGFVQEDLTVKYQSVNTSPNKMMVSSQEGNSTMKDPSSLMQNQYLQQQQQQQPQQIANSAHKNTLNQLLINLSVNVTIPSDLNTRAYAQIREEVISVDLSPSQQKKYEDIALVLVKSGYYDGSDIDKFSRITALLRMICFHSQLVTIKKMSSITNSTNGGGESVPQHCFLSYRPSLSNKTNESTISTTTLSNNTNLNNFSTNNYGTTSFSSGNLAGLNSVAVGSSVSSNKASTVVNNSIYFSQGPLIPKLNNPLYAHSITESMLGEGSNKLKQLKLLLHRFAGLRVVLVAGNWLELSLIHHYLELNNIEHLHPHLLLQNGKNSLKDQQNPLDYMNNPIFSGRNSDNGNQRYNDYFHSRDRLYWLSEENNIQLFNDASVLSSILLTSLNVFKSPSMTPWLADAVILLSHEWDSYCDIKNCFRLRLLKSGPRGDPVTIIRVSSKNTIEDVMLKQKTGLPQLQGMKLSDLNLIQKPHTPPPSYANIVASGSYSATTVGQGYHKGDHPSSYSNPNFSSAATTVGGGDNNDNFSNGFITNITFLKNIPLMQVKNFNTLPNPSNPGQAYHSTPVSPMGMSTSYDHIRNNSPSMAMMEPESQSNSGNEGNPNNNNNNLMNPPRRGSGKGILLKSSATATAMTNHSWTSSSNRQTLFHDDTNVPYNSTTGNSASNRFNLTSSSSNPNLSTQYQKIDKAAVQKWLENYLQHLNSVLLELMNYPSIEKEDDSDGNNSSSSSPPSQPQLQQQQSGLVIKNNLKNANNYYYNLWNLGLIEKEIIHKVYILLFQRSQKLLLSSKEGENSIYTERDFSHELSFFLSNFESVFMTLFKPQQQGSSSFNALESYFAEQHLSFTEVERLRLKLNGFGMSEKESKILRLFLPVNVIERDSFPSAGGGAVASTTMNAETMSVISSTGNNNNNNPIAVNSNDSTNGSTNPHLPHLPSSVPLPGTTVATALSVAGVPPPSQAGGGGNAQQQSRGHIYQYFQDALQEAMRLGHSIEPWLYVNPLQSASRFDQVAIPSSQWEFLDAEECPLKIKYMNSNYKSVMSGVSGGGGSLSSGGAMTASMMSGTTTTGGGGGGGSSSRHTSSGGGGGGANKKMKTSSGSSSTAPGSSSMMMKNNDNSFPMTQSSSSSSNMGNAFSSGMVGSLPIKRDIIGVIPSSSSSNSLSNLKNYSGTQTIAPQVFDNSGSHLSGHKRGLDNTSSSSGGGYNYNTSSTTLGMNPSIGGGYNPNVPAGGGGGSGMDSLAEKRARMEYNNNSYGVGAGGGNYSNQYGSSGNTNMIGGMATNHSNNNQFSFDINQPNRLLLSETVTPNVNMFTNNMLYEDNNNSNPVNKNLNNLGMGGSSNMSSVSSNPVKISGTLPFLFSSLYFSRFSCFF